MLNTVNVLEIVDTDDMAINQLASFPDDATGNKAAEALFTTLLGENGVPAEEFDDCIENGYYENGTYYLALVHSTLPNG